MLFRLIAYNAYRIRKLEFVILIWFLQGLHYHVLLELKAIYITMGSILVGSILFMIFGLPFLNVEWTQNSYLLYFILVIEVFGMVVFRYFQIKDNQNAKKVNHTKKLNEKIIKRLCTIHIMQNNGTYSLYVEAIPEQDEKIY